MQQSGHSKLLNIFGLTAIALLIFFAYYSTFFWMWQRFLGEDSYYSHGFFVPFVSLFFAYQLKGQLASAKQQSSSMGLIVLIIALFLHILGTVLYVFSISGFSLWIFLVGLTLFLFGKEITKIAWSPLLFLVFMLPLPMTVIASISFPLKMFAAEVGVRIVSMLGVPVYHEGFNIFIPAGHLLVGNPCSGLRSLIVFLAMGFIFACLSATSSIKKWLLFLFSIPIALFSNIIRISILVLASHYWGLEAAAPETLIHTGTGILVFVVGFSLLFLIARMFEWRT